MQAHILALGSFGPEVVDCLDYPPEDYANTTVGTVVVARFMYCNARNCSFNMAEAFGVTISDFNTHLIKKKNIIWQSLSEMFEVEQIDKLRKLIDHNFSLIFLVDY